MKTALFFIIALLTLSVSCTTDSAIADINLVIVIDITDPLTSKPDEEAIFKKLNLSKEIWQGVEVKITCISEFDINPEIIISLPKSSSWTGNTSIREARIGQFKKDIHNAISKLFNKSKASLGHSIVYRTLAKELSQLSNSPSKKRCMIVYSDLVHNDTISFYAPETLNALKTRPQDIQAKLERSYPIGPLHNVDIYCIFTPDSYEANYQYMVVGGFFKHLFESKSAKVILGNSLN